MSESLRLYITVAKRMGFSNRFYLINKVVVEIFGDTGRRSGLLREQHTARTHKSDNITYSSDRPIKHSPLACWQVRTVELGYAMKR